MTTDSPSPDAIPLETKLAVRLHLRIATCRNLLMRESRRSVEPWGLTLPQFDVLAELGRAKRAGFTFGELSRLLLVTSGNLTGIVDRLEREGLALRQHDKRDRRVVRIVLTRKGRQLIAQILPLHARNIQNSLAFMPTEQLNLLCELLGTVRHCLRDRPAAAEQTGNVPRPRHSVKEAGPHAEGRAPVWRDDHKSLDETLFVRRV